MASADHPVLLAMLVGALTAGGLMCGVHPDLRLKAVGVGLILADLLVFTVIFKPQKQL